MAIGDIVDANGNVIKPAQTTQGGGGGGGDEDGGAGQAFQYGMVGAVPFGKTIGAGIETAESYLPKWMRAPGDAPVEQTGEGWAQRYAENRARIGATAKNLQEAHPYATVAGSVAPLLAAPEMGTARWAAYGAGSGLSEGLDDPNWTPGSVLAQTVLGGAGGAIGSEAGKLLAPAAAGTRDAVLAAAKRLRSTASPEGVPMPRYSVGSGLTQQFGKIGFSIPGMSTPLREESEKSFQALSSAASDVAAGATKESAGASMKAGLKNWIGPVSQGDIDAEYNKVTQALTNPNAVTPLSGTASAARQIIQRRGSLQDPSGALQQVQRALTIGGGTYNDIKALRTSIGQLMESSNLPADVSGAELKTLYGGLSSDLERAAYTSGGQNAVNAHLSASQFASDTAARREQLTELLGGPKGDDSNEAVYGALKTAAGETKGADIALLRQARSVVPPQSWDRLAQGMVSTLGRDADGNFSTSRFITDYGKISDAAKNELFATNTPLRQNLDDLHTVSQQWKHLEKYANPSGSGGHVVGAAALIHGWHAPLETLGMFLGAQQFGKLLATPAGAGAFGAFSRAVGSRNIRAVQHAAARVTATAAAQGGARADPMALAALALHHFVPEAVEGGAGNQSGNVPQ